jgi:hypothetical protein
VNVDAAIREIKKDMGPPEFRAGYGQHVKYAWVVRGLVEQGYGVSESVRHVVEKAGLTPPAKVERSLRASYYKIRLKEWPAEHAEAAATEGIPKEETDDFEV